MMMLDHVGLAVADCKRSKAFSEHALAPLGMTLLMEFDGAVAGFGKDDGGSPDSDDYGGYVLDPDGNNVEALCHRPPAVLHP